MSNLSQDDRENIDTALRFVDFSGSQRTFDRSGALADGLDETFANEFETSFNETLAKLAASSSAGRSSASAQAANSLLPAQVNCALAIAGLGVASVAAVIAIFASGGTLAIALAGYGLSGASVLGSCYNADGSPVI